MKRRFRLTKSNDFQRVRRLGKSYAHPLIVLIAQPNEQNYTHWAVVAGKSVGGAVQRNRAKRVLRATSQALLSDVQEGWDFILIARHPLLNATYDQVQSALQILLRRAQVIREPNGQ